MLTFLKKVVANQHRKGISSVRATSNSKKYRQWSHRQSVLCRFSHKRSRRRKDAVIIFYRYSLSLRHRAISSPLYSSSRLRPLYPNLKDWA